MKLSGPLQTPQPRIYLFSLLSHALKLKSNVSCRSFNLKDIKKRYNILLETSKIILPTS